MLELGSIDDLASELGVSVPSARRLVTQGSPLRWSERRLSTFANALYVQAHQNEKTRDSAVKTELEKRRRAPVYTEAAQRAIVATLARELALLDKRRVCEPGRWSPRASLAGELGVPSRQLGRWLETGRVPQEFMERAAFWAQARAERDVRRIAERSKVEVLIDKARTPGVAHTLTGDDRRERKMAHRAPDLKTNERLTESEERSGYLWELRVEKWSTFELIDQWCAWAASRQRPKGLLFKPARAWIILALCTIYHPQGRAIGRNKSPGARRQFESQADRKMGKDLSLNTPVSSCTVRHGGLPRAVRLFRDAITVEHCEFDQVYVHGIIVRNWRWRTETEKRNYRARVAARIANEASLAERKKEKARAAQRALAKQKALGRRPSAASSRPAKKRRTTPGRKRS